MLESGLKERQECGGTAVKGISLSDTTTHLKNACEMYEGVADMILLHN
jgi:hypothetical protein